MSWYRWDNAFASSVLELCACNALIQVELNIALLEVMIVHLDMPRDALILNVHSPCWDELATPEVLEVEIVAGDLHFDRGLICEYWEVGSALPELSVYIGIQRLDSLITMKELRGLYLP